MHYNHSKSLEKTKTLVGMAIFTALVIVLQLLSTFITNAFAITPPSLVLIPIVIGAAIYGAKAGVWLGATFGLIVLFGGMSGFDKFTFALFSLNPAMTALICLGKGAIAGWLTGLVYRLLAKKNRVFAIFAAAVTCPLVNTGLFTLGAFTVLRETISSWQASVGLEGENFVRLVFVVLIGVNFLIELAINLVLSPVIVRVIKVRKHTK